MFHWTGQAQERLRAQGTSASSGDAQSAAPAPGVLSRFRGYIRRIKAMHPATEIMLYINTPLPPRKHALNGLRPINIGVPQDLQFPASADGWAAPPLA